MQDGLTLDQLNAYEAEQAKYDQPIAAAVLGAARGATFNLSDVALTATGIYKPEELKAIEEQSPTASMLGNIGGVITPALLSGGTSLLGAGARLAAAPVRNGTT